jgi:hypothetical protein
VIASLAENLELTSSEGVPATALLWFATELTFAGTTISLNVFVVDPPALVAFSVIVEVPDCQVPPVT